jgi:hypothetical protein
VLYKLLAPVVLHQAPAAVGVGVADSVALSA